MRALGVRQVLAESCGVELGIHHAPMGDRVPTAVDYGDELAYKKHKHFNNMILCEHSVNTTLTVLTIC